MRKSSLFTLIDLRRGWGATAPEHEVIKADGKALWTARLMTRVSRGDKMFVFMVLSFRRVRAGSGSVHGRAWLGWKSTIPQSGDWARKEKGFLLSRHTALAPGNHERTD